LYIKAYSTESLDEKTLHKRITSSAEMISEQLHRDAPKTSITETWKPPSKKNHLYGPEPQ